MLTECDVGAGDRRRRSLSFLYQRHEEKGFLLSPLLSCNHRMDWNMHFFEVEARGGLCPSARGRFVSKQKKNHAASLGCSSFKEKSL